MFAQRIKGILFLTHILTAAAVLSLAAGCGGSEGLAGEDVDKIVLPVSGAVAVKRDVVRSLNFSGNIDAHRRAAVAPAPAAAGSRIVRIYVEEGQAVAEGQLLVRLEDYQLQQLEAQVAQFEADFNRMASLYSRGSVPAQQYEQAGSALASARAGRDMLKNSIELRAPFSGTIIGRYINEGEIYMGKPGYDGTVGVLSIAQLDRMEIVVMASEQELVHLRYGQPARVTLSAFPERVFEGKVTTINPSINRKSRTANVTIAITDKKKELRPGMFARVEIAVKTVNNVLAVPLTAVMVRGDTAAYVFTVENKETPFKTTPKLTRIKAGLTTLQYVEILEGISEQAIVLIDNHVHLTDETEILVTEIFKN